jgi:acyl carrier protein
MGNNESYACAEEIVEIIAQVLKLERDDLGSNPSEHRTPGWDSAATVEIACAIEDRLTVEIPDSVLAAGVSYRDLVRAVCGGPLRSLGLQPHEK